MLSGLRKPPEILFVDALVESHSSLSCRRPSEIEQVRFSCVLVFLLEGRILFQSL